VVSLEQRRLLISSEVIIRVDPQNVVNEKDKKNNEARLVFYGDNVRALKLHYQVAFTYLQSVIAMIKNPNRRQEYEKELEAAWKKLVQDLGKEIMGVLANAFPDDPILQMIAKSPHEAIENIVKKFAKYCASVLQAFNNKTLLDAAEKWEFPERLEDVLENYRLFIEVFKDPKISQKDILFSLETLASTAGYAYGLLEALLVLAESCFVFGPPKWMTELKTWFNPVFYSTIVNLYCEEWLFHCRKCYPDACIEVHRQFVKAWNDAYEKHTKYLSYALTPHEHTSLTGVEKKVEFIIEPNPIKDVNTATFKAVGPASVEITEIEVQVFDISGKLLWKGTTWGNKIAWHTQDLTGAYLANGVYLCVVRCKIQDTWIQSSVLKVTILR